MTKNIFLVAAAIALTASVSGAWAKAVPTLTPDQLATYCAQPAARQSADVLLSTGHGNPLSLTVHCDSTEVGSTTDTGETEQGPTEAAENGVED